MQITGDNEEGKREFDNFINSSEPCPVIAVTSKLMATGVDAQTCKLIVLDSNIGSMTEFKQIIGRGNPPNSSIGSFIKAIVSHEVVPRQYFQINSDLANHIAQFGYTVQYKHFAADFLVE